MIEPIATLIIGALFGWLSARSVALYAARLERQESAKAIAAGMWAELSTFRDTNARLKAPENYRAVLDAWIETGVFPDKEFYAEALSYDVADEYPYYAAVLSEVGALGHELAAKVAEFHTLERVIRTAVLRHIKEEHLKTPEESKETARIVSGFYAEFLVKQDALVDELAAFRPRLGWLQRRLSGGATLIRRQLD